MTYLDQARVEFDWEFPLAEVILDFFDRLKTISRGYASLDYEMLGYRESDLVKLDMLINGDAVDAFSVIIHRDKAYEYGRKIADKLQGAHSAAAVRGRDPGGDRQQDHRAVIGEGAAQGRAREVLRRRHHAKAQAPREAERGEEAHEAGGRGRDSAGSISGGAAGRTRERRRVRRSGRCRSDKRVQFSLVIQTSFLGDVVLTTPLDGASSRASGSGACRGDAGGAPLLARNPDVAGVTIYDKRGSARGVGGLANVAAELSRGSRSCGERRRR